jgi:uncharacterized repeat protein (TIGR01451 family)
VNNDNDISGNGNLGEDEDDHDYADVFVRVFDLAMMKLLAPTQDMFVQPGDTVHYRIRVINQGTIPADNILVTDLCAGGNELQCCIEPDLDLQYGAWPASNNHCLWQRHRAWLQPPW